MAEWIVPAVLIAALTALIAWANYRMGRIRKDGRPNQVPWGMVMVVCALGIFIMIVHLMNIAGFQTGPEHSLLGRF